MSIDASTSLQLVIQVEIALAEANVQFTRYEIDLQNKPEWYLPKVNPVGKVNILLRAYRVRIIMPATGPRHCLWRSQGPC